MKDTKSLAWLLPVAGLLILFGWFLGRAGWNFTKLDVGIGELEPPTATSALQTTQPTLTSPTVTSGKYPCPLVVKQSEVERWKVGQASVPAVQEAINQFDAKRPYNEGAFAKGTEIPGGVVVATNFDERDANAWTQSILSGKFVHYVQSAYLLSKAMTFPS